MKTIESQVLAWGEKCLYSLEKVIDWKLPKQDPAIALTAEIN